MNWTVRSVSDTDAARENNKHIRDIARVVRKNET